MLDIIFILVGIIALVNSNSSMAKKFKLPYKYEQHLHYLLFYHVFFSMFFTWYIINFGGDSQGYWKFGMQQVVLRGDVSWFAYFGDGTTFILWLCYIPSQLLGLSYLTGNILFGFLGFIGIRYIFVMVADLFPANHSVLNIPLFPTVFYFLNLHFWSAGVGKDSICFWGIAWFLFTLQNFKGRWWQAAFPLLFVYMARPHIGFALLAGSGIAILLGSEIKPTVKILLSSIALIGVVYLSANTLEALRIEDFSLETLGDLAGQKVGNLNSSYVGSGVDIASYSWPMKLFTYMFRPLFFDAHNIVSFFSSFENLLYLWLSLFIYRNWTPEAIRDMPLFIKAGMITFIPVTLAFMNSLSNLGIVMRMKNMTMIYFLLFCFFLIAYNKHLRLLKVQEKMRYFQRREEIIRKKAETATPPPVAP